MEVFIEKFCRRYNLSETDVKALTEQMQEVRFRKKEAIVIEGERNSNLYLIKEGIWRGHYLKDGTDTTIWFASVGEIAFSIWGYADNSISQISIEACNDSIAYSIPRHLLTKLFDSSLGLANLGRRLMEQQLLTTENWLLSNDSPRAKERYLTLIRETPELSYRFHIYLPISCNHPANLPSLQSYRLYYSAVLLRLYTVDFL